MKNVLKKYENMLIGLFAGIISGFFGAGGGLILIPIMTKILKKDETTARATTIFCVFFMVITSCVFYIYKATIDWNLGIKCILGRSYRFCYWY